MKSNLNEKQREAVYLDFGPAMILAGPGSGKTTVILERIKYLIYDLHISPKQILVITSNTKLGHFYFKCGFSYQKCLILSINHNIVDKN